MTNATSKPSRFDGVRTRYKADVWSDWAIASAIVVLVVWLSIWLSTSPTGFWYELRVVLAWVAFILLIVGGVLALIKSMRRWGLSGLKFSFAAGALALVVLLGQWIVPAVSSLFTPTSSQQQTTVPVFPPATSTATPTPAPSTGQNGQAQGSSTGNRGSNPYFAESDNGTSGTGQQSSGSNGNTKQVVQPTPKAYETCYYTAYDAAKGSNNFGPRLKKETKQAAVDRAVWKIKNDCLWAATKVWMHDNKVSDPNKVDLNAVRSLAMKYDADPATWRSDVARVNKDVKSVKFVKVSKHYSTLGMKTYGDGSMPTLLKSHKSAAQGWTLVTTYHNGTVLQQRTACDMQFSIPDKA